MRATRLPLAAALGVALVSAAAAQFIARDASTTQQRRFAAAAATADELIRDRVQAQIALLQGGAGVFAAAPSLTCRQFADFVQRMELDANYPGTLGVGYTARLDRDTLPAFEQLNGLTIWPAGDRDEYHSIRCLAPLDRRNREALGYDMSTEPLRREAMGRARDTGKAALSARVELVQEIGPDRQPGFLIYVPVYLGETVPPDVASRRRDLRGFVYSPLRAGDFLRGTLDAAAGRVHLEVFDGASTDPAALLYRDGGTAAEALSPIVRTMDVGGHRWTMRFRPVPTPQLTRGRSIAAGVLAAGLVLSLLLYRALARARQAAAEADVAERRARESSELARRGAEQLASIMDAVPALVSFIDLDERYLVVNRRYEEWFGRPRAAIEGRTAREVLGDEVYSAAGGALRQALAGRAAAAEATFRFPDGSEHFVLASYTPHRDSEGAVQGAIALLTAITELKKAQLAVEASEANLRAVLNTSLDAVIQMDQDGRVAFWNPRAEEIFGWTEDETRGRPVAELIVPEALRDAHRGGLAHLLATGHGPILGRRIEVPAVRRDGCEIPVELTVTAIRRDDRLSFNAFVSDLSDRKRAETARKFLTDAAIALSSSLERDQVRALIANRAVPYLATGAAIVIFEGPGTVGFSCGAGTLSGEQAAAWHARLSARQADAGDWTGLADTPDAGNAVALPLSAGSQTMGALVLEGRGAAPGRPEEDRALIEEYARRAAMALYNAQLYEQAQTANRLKDEFLSTLSHELRTPANAILGWAQMALDGAAEGRDVSRALEAVLRNAHAQNELISDILDAQRLTIGKVRLDLGQVDVDQVITAAIESVRPTALAKRVALRPRLCEAGIVIGDAERLQQVFWNLLSNAIKFTPAGGAVDIECRRSRRGVTIEVRDTGPGIAPDFLPFVFERFRQADASATKNHRGLGLGLAIAKNLTELHGGTIEAANRTDGRTGARICVHLPARDVQE